MTHDQIVELLRQAAVYVGSGGILVPLIVAFINSATWPTQVKQVVMFAVAIIVGSLSYFVLNGWDFSSPYGIAVAVAGVITAAQTAYHGLWKKGGITDAITNARTIILHNVGGKNTVQPAVIPPGVTPQLPADDPLLQPTPTPAEPTPAAPTDPEPTK